MRRRGARAKPPGQVEAARVEGRRRPGALSRPRCCIARLGHHRRCRRAVPSASRSVRTALDCVVLGGRSPTLRALGSGGEGDPLCRAAPLPFSPRFHRLRRPVPPSPSAPSSPRPPPARLSLLALISLLGLVTPTYVLVLPVRVTHTKQAHATTTATTPATYSRQTHVRTHE